MAADPFEPSAIALGARIRALRGTVSRKALAEAIGIDAGHLMRLEQGRSVPSIANLFAIAAALKVPPADLLEAYALRENSDASRPGPAALEAAVRAERMAAEALEAARQALELARKDAAPQGS